MTIESKRMVRFEVGADASPLHEQLKGLAPEAQLRKYDQLMRDLFRVARYRLITASQYDKALIRLKNMIQDESRDHLAARNSATPV
jgi:hypothetical protein